MALPALLDWIAEASGYDVGALRRDPPEIVFCDIGDLIDYEGAGLMVEPYMHAAYDLPAHRIHLVRPWDASDPKSLSELLHELVHVAQLAARDWRCVGEPEWEAYKLQERWLIEQGAPTDFNWLVIYRLSRCPGDGFP